MSEFKYVGAELDLFADVLHWKAYWSSQVRPFVKGDVVEVGAGIGSNTRLLDADNPGRWVCLEPDPQLSRKLGEGAGKRDRGVPYEMVCGTLESLRGQQFDTLIYIDVLEHIEHDAQELEIAASHLRPGGHIIVLSPAHQRLFSPFDAAIGHFRRYNRSMLRGISSPGLRLVRLRYLDSLGMATSVANALLLRQSMPTKSQLKLWDRWIVPVSRVIDPFLLYRAGKSILAIWQKT